MVGIVLGGQPIFGYNYGAGNMDRVHQAYKLGLTSTLAVAILCLTIPFFRQIKK